MIYIYKIPLKSHANSSDYLRESKIYQKLLNNNSICEISQTECSESSDRYMKCQSFNKEFKAGDNLEFKQGNKTAGVFTVPWRHNCSVGSISLEMFFVWLTSLQLRYQLSKII